MILSVTVRPNQLLLSVQSLRMSSNIFNKLEWKLYLGCLLASQLKWTAYNKTIFWNDLYVSWSSPSAGFSGTNEQLFVWMVFIVMQSKRTANRRDKSTRHYTDPPFILNSFPTSLYWFQNTQNPIELSESCTRNLLLWMTLRDQNCQNIFAAKLTLFRYLKYRVVSHIPGYKIANN